MKIRLLACSLMAATVVAVGIGASSQMLGGPEYTSDFRLEHCDFDDDGRNAYFSLVPGRTLWFEAFDEEGALEELRIQVLPRTKRITLRINGVRKRVRTRIVEEREWVDGELVEVSRNYFARCRRTGNIYYFGEDVDIYEKGQLVSHEGAWLAGRRGAQPGLIMPSVFLLGSRYFQEVADGVALDRAKHVEMGLTVTTPAGTFTDCVRIIETTPLEPDQRSEKIYAPEVGLICDDGIELVRFQ